MNDRTDLGFPGSIRMKSPKIYYLILMLILGTELNAQSFNAGILAGVNASQVSGDGYSGFDKAGILVGLFSNIDVSKRINMQMEINYSQKGSRRNPNTDEGDTDFFLLRMNYIEIPVMARTQYKRFKFEAGAYYSQLINFYLENENGEFDIPDGLNRFNNYDVGFLVGVNFEFTENLVMNWRYSNSAIRFREYDSEANFLFDSGMFHNYFSFNFRYVFYGQ